ncbi:hypothetical protein PV325_006807 [Microctonus aethiopoides]|nr:hypothetical protein PV325_006807 [Microctonus aethiopoides]KAK0096333.1 hypothetical protein PV326_005761 [Microctonus aethiopoides]KAK0171965.1 hypothetical protein PV328_005351 [Microctonus aethiopoides]
MIYFLLLVILTTVNCYQPRLEPFSTVFSWKQLDFNFPNDTLRQAYLQSGDYIPQNIAPLGMNVWGDKLFLAVPRWKKGVPATLNYINITEAKASNVTSPLLNPYPDWASNDVHTPGSLVHVIRPRIDACNRLWVVDSGVEASFVEREVIHPQQLIAIDLNTNKIIVKYTFKESDVKPNSLLADLVIDVDPNSCEDAYVYNSDNTAPALVVYSLAKNDSWRIEHNYFLAEPLEGFFNVSGIQFSLPDGILGMSLSLPKADGSKTLFFHSISGIHEFAVSTYLLKNQVALADRLFYRQFQVVGNRGLNTQATSSILDVQSGIMYMTQINKNAIACWDTHSKLSSRTFYTVAQDDEKLSYTNDIILEPKSRNVYILSDKVPILIFSKFNLNETNFYVHAASLDSLKSACKRHSRSRTQVRIHFMDKGSTQSMTWMV